MNIFVEVSWTANALGGIQLYVNGNSILNPSVTTVSQEIGELQLCDYTESGASSTVFFDYAEIA